MAIQVNGTEVISNSRALNNIASVDATTVATLNAAGIGGASGVGAISWTPLFSPTSSTLNDVATDGNGTWVAVGSSGTVIRSTNNGVSWSTVGTPWSTTPTLSCIGYGNGVWIVGMDSSSVASHYNQVLRSTNGGASWGTATHNLNKSVSYLDNDGSGVWVCSAGREQLTRSTNDGANWSNQNYGSGSNFGGIATDGSGNWIVGGTNGNSVRTSSNNGVSWTTRTVSNVGYGTKIATDKNGEWVAMGGIPYRSTDNGVNWTEVPNVYTPYVFYYDTDAGAYILQQTSNTITSSTDGFQTNSTIFAGITFRVVRGDNNGVYVAVGSGGTIYRGTA